MSHPRGFRPIRFGWPLALLAWAWGTWLRRLGRYDRHTLRCLAWAAQVGGGAALTLRWLMFRRDLGLTLPRRWWPAVAALAEDVATPATLGKAEWRRRAAATLLADVGAWSGVSEGEANAGMSARRAAFLAWLAQQCVGAPQSQGLCLVGNAAGLRGQSLGPRIDAHAVVLRFNRWWEGRRGLPADPGDMADLGGRLDVWACSPNPAQLPPQRPAWVVVSGPDPVVALARWPGVQRLLAQGVPVVTVPLSVWRLQVRQLHAPPSAGVLLLGWLAEVGATTTPGPWTGWQGVAVAGIGWGLAPDGRRHLTQSNRATGSRHAWSAEAMLVAGWRAQGLRDLSAGF